LQSAGDSAKVVWLRVSKVVRELKEDVQQLFFVVFDSEHYTELRESRLDATVHELVDCPVEAVRHVDEQSRIGHHFEQD